MATNVPSPNPAEAYERHIVQNMFVPWTADLLQRALPQAGERVLDLACGTGIVTRSVASIVGTEGTVTGLDISPGMLEVARSLTPSGGAKVEWREGSGTELPFEDGSFDLVLCQQGLQFFPDARVGLKEIKRVLTAEGRAIISLWRNLAAQPVMKAFDTVVSRHVAPGAFGPPFSLGDSGIISRLASEAGFSNVDIQQADLTIRVGNPDEFAPMMLRGATAVLPGFAVKSPAEREQLFDQMKADLSDAVKPFVQQGTLVMDTTVNVLIARH
jgi:SAM-dependent methyltransferase